MEPEIHIPGYHVEKQVGEGGFAKVFAATQISLDRRVALKIMNPGMLVDAEFSARFLKEGKIIARLSQHPNIVTIHDIGSVGESYYMAMEYLGSESLKEKLSAGRNIASPMKLLREVAAGLAYAHEQGFVHRDVKPGNILFHDDGTAVLTDFGIAKGTSDATQLTKVGYAVGTPEYMSPEQAQGKALDGRADIYSLGIVLYEILAGKKPYLADDPFATAMKHITDPLPVLPENCTKYQPLLDRMLSKSPQERFADCSELMSVIDTQYTENIDPPDFTMSKLKLVFTVVFLGVSITAASVLGWKMLNSDNSMVPLVPEMTDTQNDEDAFSMTLQSDLPDADGRAKVIRLLEAATAHEAIGRIHEPAGSSACDAYQLVLVTEPGHQLAESRIQQLNCSAQ